MLLEFSIKNYRSIKEKATLSMIADGYDSKLDNVFTYTLPNDKELRLLNTALIFGANGSGKSNLLKGLFELLFMLDRPAHAGKNIKYYDPFKFNSKSDNEPVEFEIKFLDSANIPYQYNVSFSKTEIVKEELIYSPNGRATPAFERITNIADEQDVHHLKIGNSAQEGREIEKVYKNNFGISHFSSLSPNKVILGAFKAIQKLYVVNTLNDRHRSGDIDKIGELLLTRQDFNAKINALIRYADLNINEVKAELTNTTQENDTRAIRKFKLLATHQYYDGENKTEFIVNNPLFEESQGSQTILGLGSEIILSLEKGGVLFVDEFETSLHPMLSMALIKIFQNKKLNPKKAQLVFTTHDTNLMDHNTFRRDQIWFTSKNNRGETALFSMVDFSELREGHVFEKWYLSGKFGGVPNLDFIENAFG